MSIKSWYYKQGGKNYLKWYYLDHDQSNLHEALKKFSDAIRVDRKDLEAYRYQVLVLMIMTKPKEALALFDEALKNIPEKTDEINSLKTPILHYHEYCLENNYNNIISFEEFCEEINEALKNNY